MGSLGAAYYFFLIAKSLLLAPGYAVLRGALCGFPFGSAPTTPEGTGTLPSRSASPARGAADRAAGLRLLAVALGRDLKTQGKYGHLCFSATRQTAVSALSDLTEGSSFAKESCTSAPPAGWGSWLAKARRRGWESHLKSKVQKCSEWKQGK